MLKKEIEGEFRLLCEQAGRQGVIGFVPIGGVRLLPVQSAYLRRKLDGLGPVLSPALSAAEGEAEGPWSNITAISVGLLYHEPEILAIGVEIERKQVDRLKRLKQERSHHRTRKTNSIK